LRNVCHILFLSHIIANQTNGQQSIKYDTNKERGKIEMRQTPIFEETSRSKIGG
jgi:hypothetical protein